MMQLIASLAEIQDTLLQAGYLPNGELPRTAEGLPICTRHAVPMRQREKQGDTWYSHSVTDPTTGEIMYCKGRPGKDSPGWRVDMDANAPEPHANGTAEPKAQAEANTPTAYWQVATTLITAGKLTQTKPVKSPKATDTGQKRPPAWPPPSEVPRCLRGVVPRCPQVPG